MTSSMLFSVPKYWHILQYPTIVIAIITEIMRVSLPLALGNSQTLVDAGRDGDWLANMG